MCTTQRFWFVAAVLLCGSIALAQQFKPIPPLEGDQRTVIWSVSGDGSVVVGTSGEYPDERAFYWTALEGSVPLEPLRDSSSARGVSADGSTIVGNCGSIGVRWVNGEIEILEATEEFPYIFPFDVSADGNVIAGRALPEQGPFGIAMRWTPEDGIVDLGSLNPDDFPVIAYTISDDGQVLAGISAEEAFRWTETLGIEGLGFLPGFEDFSIATCINADGSVIGGQADIGFEPGYASTYWTEATGWVEILPIIPSASVANTVNGISGDASIMVGINTGFDPPAREVFIWDEVNGPRELQQTLEQDYGIDFQGWQLAGMDPPYNNDGNVVGISTDGNAIVGITLNPDTMTQWGWIAMRQGGCVPGDIDGDGDVDTSDLLSLLGAWGPCPGCPQDVDGDGDVDTADLLTLLGNWGPY